MHMASWMGAGMVVVDDMVRDKASGGWSHVGRCRSIPRVRGDTLMTPDRTALQLLCSGYGRAGIGRSSWKVLSTGRHEKAPVRC